MAKYHIDVNGAPAACSATTRACPRGGEEEHGSTPQEVLEKYEAKHAANTMPKAVKKPSKADQLRKSLSKIAIQDSKLKRLDDEHARVMGSIKNELDSIAMKRRGNSNVRDAAIAATFEASDIEDFADKETAEKLYKLGWDNGSGGKGWIDLTRRLTAKSPISMGLWTTTGKNTTPVEGLGFHVDDVDDEQIARAAEIIEKIYPTQQELQPTIRVSVHSNKEGMTISRDPNTEEWTASSNDSSTIDFASTDLKDVLKHVQKEHEDFGNPDDWSRGW